MKLQLSNVSSIPTSKRHVNFNLNLLLQLGMRFFILKASFMWQDY